MASLITAAVHFVFGSTLTINPPEHMHGVAGFAAAMDYFYFIVDGFTSCADNFVSAIVGFIAATDCSPP
jgi:hypothetical protein